MTPYYSDALVTLYHADCREVLPGLDRCDLVLTDPPYGIGADRNLRANRQHGRAAAPSKDYGAGGWDAAPPDAETVRAVVAAGLHAIVWGGNYFGLPASAGWLVWDKDNGKNGYADCELAWTNLPQAVRRIRYRWMGMLQEHSGADKEHRWHPTQKPLPVMHWSLGHVPDARTVLDPFAGSGTTLRAAKDLGRRAIGIEIEERYCEIAAKRLSQEVLPLNAPPEAA
jgi:DNA modification methylase